jgi:NADP-dependent 3-hydroxy acid dehydrogenase YdfG
MTDLSSRTCVVTGATSGIGEAMTRSLSAAGARVWAIGRNGEKLAALVEDVQGAVVPVQADLESSEEISAAAEAITAGEGRVHVLVHSAGTISLGSSESVSAAELDRMYAVNLRAAVQLTRELLPALVRDRGQVVFVNSSAALKSSADNAAYGSTKAGLKAYADGLREDVNPHGVKVLSVFAGRTATRLQEAVHEFEGRPYRPEVLMQPQDVVDMVLAALVLPGTAEVTDLHLRPMRKPSMP